MLGPGTCDMKAGLLTGLYAMRALDHVGWRDYETITFVIVSDEEIEQRHSVELLKTEGPQHHAVLTLEAARENGDIVTARKATRWYAVEATGKAAHAGVEPEKGRSATLALAHVIVETFKLNGMKPGMTVNPGRIEGGANPNIVADRARAMFDLRAWSNADLAELSAAFERVVATPWVPGVELRAEPLGAGTPAMERTPGTVRLEEHAIRIAGDLGFPLARRAHRWRFRRELRLPRRHSGTGRAGADRRARSRSGRVHPVAAASCRGRRCWRSSCRRSAPMRS